MVEFSDAPKITSLGFFQNFGKGGGGGLWYFWKPFIYSKYSFEKSHSPGQDLNFPMVIR